MKLAFLGMGAMGRPMALNLIRAGHDVTVWNRTLQRAQEGRAAGAKVAESPASAVSHAEAAITMLADDRALEDVVRGGLLDALPEDCIHVSMSTISVALSKRLAAEHGRRFLAAPVFGRPEAAAEAKLWIIPAGDPAAIDTCRPLFETLGRGITVIGAQPWQANLVKLCGNFMIAAAIETMAEAFSVARKSGIDANLVLDVVNSALFQSPLYANYGAKVANEAFEPAGFRLRLGLKDVRLALEAAESQHVAMPLASLIRDRFLEAMAHGWDEIDWSGLARVSFAAAGLDRPVH